MKPWKLLVFLFAITVPVFADTVVGAGGVSGPIAGFSDSSFQWISTFNGGTGVSAAELSSLFGYNVLQQPGRSGAGSYLLTDPFTVGEGGSIAVDFSIFTSASPQSFSDMGFAVLLQNSQVVAILGAQRPDGVNHLDDFGCPASVCFSGPSPGVTWTKNTHVDPHDVPVMTLGSNTFGQSLDMSYCYANCMTDINASYSPGAGTYQILFGELGFGGARHASALAVRSIAVSVPEPSMRLQLGTMVLMLVGLCTLASRRMVRTN